MFRKFLIATALVAASGSVFAHDNYGYGRVISVEPYVSVAFGSGRHDGFRVVYESGGRHYWTHSAYRPGHVIVVPPPHRVHTLHHYAPKVKHNYKHHGKHWRGDDRHDWDDDRHHDRHDDRDDDRRHDHRRGDWG